MRQFTAALVAAAVLLPSPALAKEKPPIPLARVGKWEINYDADSCHLLAKFGEGENEITTNFTRYTPGDAFDLSLYGKPVKVTEQPRPIVAIAFGEQSPLRYRALAGTAGDKLPMLIFNGIRLDGSSLPPSFTPPGDHPAITPEQEGAVKSLTIGMPGGKNFRLGTGSFAAPMAAMRACADDLVKRWGYDPLILSALKQEAKALNEPGRWLKPRDFPREALSQGQSGIVQIRLDIDEKGAVNGCHILHRTNPDQFADISCKLITQRAKLSPALDASGKPVRSFYVTKILWLISAN